MELFIQTGGVRLTHVGIDKYLREVVVSHIYADRLDLGFQTHVRRLVEDRSIFYGTLTQQANGR